ncbi:GntR family transcriptional regulator [Vibrio nigripulchritudo]|uniref:GntR family transcriptional regulator n=1 Tax=Vibrio nigripulchritudo TaxID=28173 RepID=UPI0003B1DF8D|nr:GntR family transcriptional regulator [Vibrio nigripulchritudo]CCN72855.1 putative Transcriptional regulator, GntR family protein [Vibrio nigripulchritudo SFn118]
MTIDFQSKSGQGKQKKRPKYVQVSELLIREINAGHWRAGERLPVEAELAVELKVAVGTLRKALALLEQDGLLERRQGSGTYVKSPPKEAVYQLFRLELLEGGGTPHANTLSVRKERNEDVAQHFKAPITAEFWRIERQRFLNNTVIAAEEMWIRAEHAESLGADELDESLYRHYREHFGFWISRVEDRINVKVADHWAAQILDIPAHTSVGWIERISWSDDEKVEEYSRTWFNPETCHYVSRMS